MGIFGHKGHLSVYFNGYCYPPPPPPPYKQASTLHGYFVSATPLTVILLLLIYCLKFLPFVCLFSVFCSCFDMYYSVPSLVLQTSWRGRWNRLLYWAVLLMSKLCSVALPRVTVSWSALWMCGISLSYCIHGSRKYRRGGGGSNGFFSKKTIIFQGSRGVQYFPGVGGGESNFSQGGGGSKYLFPIRSQITCEFPGVYPLSPSGS